MLRATRARRDAFFNFRNAEACDDTKLLEVAWVQAPWRGKGKNGVKEQKLASEASRVVDWGGGKRAVTVGIHAFWASPFPKP